MKWNLFTRQQTQELIVPTELGGVPQHANCRPLPPRILFYFGYRVLGVTPRCPALKQATGVTVASD